MIVLSREESGRLVAQVSDDVGIVRNIDLSAFSETPLWQTRVLRPLVRWLNKTRPYTQMTNLRAIARLGIALKRWNLDAPPTTVDSWQELIHRFYEYWLTRKDSTSAIDVRASAWNRTAANLFQRLRDGDEVIPLEVHIPRCKGNVTQGELTSYRPSLLGQRSPRRPRKGIDKLLVSVSLARTDAAYLEEIRNKLANRRRVLEDCLRRWCDQIFEHYLYGQRLRSQVDRKSLAARLDAGKTRDGGGKPHTGNPHIANGSTEASLGNLLEMLVERHGSLVSHAMLETDPYLPTPPAVRIPSSAPAVVSPRVTPLQRLNWMLGNLSPLDIASLAATLIQRNPVFTPIATLEAKVFNKHGQPYIEIAGVETSFRVEKHRAAAVKSSHLDEESARLLQMVSSMTETHRSTLRASGSPLANRLFFVSDQAAIRRINVATASSNITARPRGGRNRCLNDYFPELDRVGLRKGRITFKRIRATEGVLEWFRTGSIKAMTRKLGNSSRVVIGHYLPKPLLAAWNTRQIRRFQNLWLAVAAANEDFLLQVTDFHTLEDLHAFLSDMLSLHAPGSSPLARELHERLGNIGASSNQSDSLGNASLSVPISKATLVSLYLYQESALASGVETSLLDKVDSRTRTTPRQFLNLAELLRHQLPTHRDPRLQALHDQAVGAIPELLSRIRWSELIARREDHLC